MSRKVFRRSLTTTSTTLTDLGELGDVRWSGGNKYRLVYTAASLAANAFVGWETTSTGGGYFNVQLAISTLPVIGCNTTGGTVPATSYFWMLEEGTLTLAAASWGANISAQSYLALSSDETVMDLATNTGFGIAIIGQSLAAITSTDSGTIWFQPQSGGPVS